MRLKYAAVENNILKNCALENEIFFVFFLAATLAKILQCDQSVSGNGYLEQTSFELSK